MSNKPWMPLYIADYLADTAHLGALESGGYLHLIMHYWQNGGLPTDERHLSRIAKMTDEEWAGARSTIAAFFQADWTHKRIAKELANAKRLSRKRSASAKQRWSKTDAIASQSQSHKEPIQEGKNSRSISIAPGSQPRLAGGAR